MSEKELMGEFRLLRSVDGKWTMQKSVGMDWALEGTFITMLAEQHAHDLGLTFNQLLEAMKANQQAEPLKFDDGMVK